MSERSLPISAHILTFNSASTLAAALESVQECKEILVVDGGSTDSTRQIARQYGATIVEQRPKEKQGSPLTDFAEARNVALQAATQPWILSLDSDERISPELMKELRAIVEKGSTPGAFYVPRKYMLHDGRRVDFATTYPNERLYFFHKDVVDTWIKPVHERPQLKEGVMPLHLRGASLAPLAPLEEYYRRNTSYLAIEKKKDARKGWLHWLVHRLLRTLRSRLIACIKLAYIWLLPHRGVRLPFAHERARFWYAWRLIVETCPLSRS